MKLKKLVCISISLVLGSSTALASPYTNSPTYDLSNFHNFIDSSGVSHPVGSILSTSTYGKVNGTAGLDSNANITNPLTAPLIRVGTFAGANSYAGYEKSGPLLSAFTSQTEDGNIFDLPGISLPTNQAVMIGGQTADSKGFLWTFGDPDTTNLGAVVDLVAMNGMSAGQGTGVTAGPFSSTASYGNYDAVARETRTGSTPPKFIASEAITDPDGHTHTVTFKANGAKFSPALPAYWGNMLHNGMNVATNELGVAAGAIPQNNWQSPWITDGYRRPFNTYFGTITGWTANSDGTISDISVDGWVVPEQETYGFGSSTNSVPGSTTLDKTSPALDTVFTQIDKPAIMFGMFTKAFTQYELCDFEPQGSHGDINNPKGNIGSLVHECDHEVDMWNHDPTDYLNSIHGYTLAVDNSGGGKLTRDSYGWTIAGGGALPLGYHVRNLLEGSVGYQVMANGSITQSNLYAPYAIGKNTGDTSLLQTWGNELASGGVNTSTLRLIQYRDVADTNVATESNESAQANVSMHLQWKWNIDNNPMNETGAVGGQIVYNPQGYEYGVGIGAGGSFQNPKYTMISDKNGNLWFPNGGAIMNGQGLGFVPTTGDGSGHPYIYATDNYHLKFSDSAGGEAGIVAGTLQADGGTKLGADVETVGTLTADNGITIMNGQGLGFVPSTGDGAGHPYFTASDSGTIAAKTSSGSTATISAYAINVTNLSSFNGGLNSSYINTSGIGSGNESPVSMTSDVTFNDAVNVKGNSTFNNINVSGTASLTNGATVLNGQGLAFQYANWISGQVPMFVATSDTSISLSTNAGNQSSLSLWSLTANGGITSPYINVAGIGAGSAGNVTFTSPIISKNNITLSSSSYYGITNPTADTNNVDQRIYGDADGSIYLTNFGSGASHYATTKVDNLKITALTGSGNAYACINSSGQLYRSSTPCN